ncbi:MAG: peptidylprolyl isomerase [Solirubrobacterales bacterium]
MTWGTKTFALACALVALAIAGCGDSGKQSSASGGGATTVTGANGAQKKIVCEDVKQPGANVLNLQPPKKKLDPSKTYLAKFVTSCGPFTVTLDAKRNPKTAASVAYQVDRGTYNGTWFHRVVKDFIVQGGDPFGNGTGSSGYTVVEKPHGKYKVGSMIMPKSTTQASGTSGSQFVFLLSKPSTKLPHNQAIAGRVTEGLDVLQFIGQYANADANGQPSHAVIVKQATLEVK